MADAASPIKLMRCTKTYAALKITEEMDSCFHRNDNSLFSWVPHLPEKVCIAKREISITLYMTAYRIPRKGRSVNYTSFCYAMIL